MLAFRLRAAAPSMLSWHGRENSTARRFAFAVVRRYAIIQLDEIQLSGAHISLEIPASMASAPQSSREDLTAAPTDDVDFSHRVMSALNALSRPAHLVDAEG
jgi:hypothetical protein